MDLSHTHSQQAISSSLSPPTELSTTNQPSLQILHTTPQDSSRTLRSATRARAAKQKVAKDNDIPDQTTSAPAESSSSSRQTRSNYHPYPSKRTRDTKGKGKSQETTEEQPVPRSSKKYVESAKLQGACHFCPFNSLMMSFHLQRPTYDIPRHFFLSYHQRAHSRHKGQETCCPRRSLRRTFRQCPSGTLQASPSSHNRLRASFPFRHHPTFRIRHAEKIEVTCQFSARAQS
jgi:hypothetical protein